MRRPSEEFVRKVREVWGDPLKVAAAGVAETFRHEDVFGLDHDDQVGNAMTIGVMAGICNVMSVEIFIRSFTELLNQEE